jgi:hypothetical protein
MKMKKRQDAKKGSTGRVKVDAHPIKRGGRR